MISLPVDHHKMSLTSLQQGGATLDLDVEILELADDLRLR